MVRPLGTTFTLGRILEFVPQGELTCSVAVQHRVATAPWNAKEGIPRVATDRTKDVAVEGVRHVKLEQDGLAFADLRSLDNREVLVPVTRTPPPGQCRR